MLPVFPWNPKSGSNRLLAGKTAHTIGRGSEAFAYFSLPEKIEFHLLQSPARPTSLEERANGEVWAVKVGEAQTSEVGVISCHFPLQVGFLSSTIPGLASFGTHQPGISDDCMGVAKTSRPGTGWPLLQHLLA